MAHEWTQEQRRVANIQLVNKLDFRFDDVGQVVDFDDVVDLQCEVNEARELLENACPYDPDFGRQINAWLSRNPQPPQNSPTGETK